MGEMLSAAVSAIVDALLWKPLDQGLRKHRWVQFGLLGLLAIAVGLVAGTLLRAIV
jgi:hypothetical protein